MISVQMEHSSQSNNWLNYVGTAIGNSKRNRKCFMKELTGSYRYKKDILIVLSMCLALHLEAGNEQVSKILMLSNRSLWKFKPLQCNVRTAKVELFMVVVDTKAVESDCLLWVLALPLSFLPSVFPSLWNSVYNSIYLKELLLFCYIMI